MIQPAYVTSHLTRRILPLLSMTLMIQPAYVLSHQTRRMLPLPSATLMN